MVRGKDGGECRRCFDSRDRSVLKGKEMKSSKNGHFISDGIELVVCRGRRSG